TVMILEPWTALSGTAQSVHRRAWLSITRPAGSKSLCATNSEITLGPPGQTACLLRASGLSLREQLADLGRPAGIEFTYARAYPFYCLRRPLYDLRSKRAPLGPEAAWCRRALPSGVRIHA